MEELIDSDAAQSLRNVLLRVGKRNYSLFVGVNEYEAPAHNTALLGGHAIRREFV